MQCQATRLPATSPNDTKILCSLWDSWKAPADGPESRNTTSAASPTELSAGAPYGHLLELRRLAAQRFRAATTPGLHGHPILGISSSQPFSVRPLGSLSPLSSSFSPTMAAEPVATGLHDLSYTVSWVWMDESGPNLGSMETAHSPKKHHETSTPAVQGAQSFRTRPLQPLQQGFSRHLARCQASDGQTPGNEGIF